MLVTTVQERIAQSRPAGEEGRSSKEDVGGEEKGMTAVVKGSHMSLVDASHTSCVTDLQWLPGMAFTRDGRPPTATRVNLLALLLAILTCTPLSTACAQACSFASVGERECHAALQCHTSVECLCDASMRHCCLLLSMDWSFGDARHVGRRSVIQNNMSWSRSLDLNAILQSSSS